MATEFSDQPFSFSEILAAAAPAENQNEPETAKLLASDGVELSVKIYEPPSDDDGGYSNTSLLFYHGGGAHSGGGYQCVARGLSEKFAVTVYLPDIRGHGQSGGPRGDAPSKEQVWRDVDAALRFVAKRQQQQRQQQQNRQQQQGKTEEEPSKIFLGGHSSGGGLVLNYATRAAAQQQQQNDDHDDSSSNAPSPLVVDGYVLVAPELGYNSGTARPDRKEFASVSVLPFIANAMFGILGHSKAVKFGYPPELLEADPGLVGFNTVNMASAITPENPRQQMESMTTTTTTASSSPLRRPPVGLWVGSDDELFDAEKVADFVKEGVVVPNNNTNDSTTPGSRCSRNASKIVPGKNHLGILVDIHEEIGPWIAAPLR